MNIHNIWQYYPSIASELTDVQKIILQNTKIRNKEIEKALKLFFHDGGKLLRPAFFLYFTHFGEETNGKKKSNLGASLEILHAATLIHDDIIDDSPLRRNLPSIQSVYGKNVAVYTGDFLFTVYFQLLAGSVNSLGALEKYAAAMKKILIGELDQMSLQYNAQVTIKEYLRYLKGKTAQLFQLSCFMGATFSKSSVRTQILSQRIGHQVGMAFQIQDDILDYSSTEAELQKPVFEDVQNGIYTLPLIFALQKHPEALMPLLEKKEKISDKDMQVISDIILSSGSLDEAKEVAKNYTQKALNNISKLPDIPIRKELYQLTADLLDRTY